MANELRVPRRNEYAKKKSTQPDATVSSSQLQQAFNDPAPSPTPSDDGSLRADVQEMPMKRRSALRWVTTTHPDQVKDKQTMKNIRAHALKNSEYHQQRIKKPKITATLQSLMKIAKKSKIVQNCGDINPEVDPEFSKLRKYPCEGRSQSSPESTYSSSDSSELSLWNSVAFAPPLFHHSGPKISIRRLLIEDLLNPNQIEAMVHTASDDDQKIHDDWAYGITLANPGLRRNPGSTIDPFRALPQFSNPHVKVEQLQYFCTMLRNDTWGPQHSALVMNSRLVYLSSVCAGAAYREALYGIAGESLTSAAVKAEVINMINERLRDPVLQADDETIAAVSHMINFEVFHSEPRLVTHIRGLEQLILQRGGLIQFSSNNPGQRDKSADLITRGLRVQSRVMGGCLVNELQPDPRWQSFMPLAPNSDTQILPRPPESPAHGIKIGDSHLATHCASETFNLLCDMQHLTSILFDLEAVTAPGVASVNDSVGMAKPDLQNNPIALAIYESLRALPSASFPDHHLSNDWTFECCRLISLIYATAIIRRVPFSEATPLAATIFQTPNILQALYIALRKTDLESCWGKMSGCLFWVSTVACPATHLPDGMTRSAKDVLAKKWFIMIAIRANSLPAQRYGHGSANDAAMRLLLRVQAAIA